jgi:hypothetical protein
MSKALGWRAALWAIPAEHLQAPRQVLDHSALPASARLRR